MPKSSKNSLELSKTQKLLTIGAIVLFIVVAFCLGRSSKKGLIASSASSNPSTCLRLNGYTYISPLLLCNTVNSSSSFPSFQSKLTTLINQAVANHSISAVSVYFRDLTTNQDFTINPDTKFYPASLNKIPAMLAAYRMAEQNPSILTQQIPVPPTDYNTGLEIQPSHTLAPGSTTTVEIAIEYMIEYSDNNAFYALTNFITPSIYDTTFTDLDIPQRTSPEQPEDYMTVENFSEFFRILYNSTYLTSDLSEKALGILAQSDFVPGIVAGVPKGTFVSQKFGIDSVYSTSNVVLNRELHNCGIIYATNKPYLLCVMTKSSATLSQNEQVIQSISALTYSEVMSNYP